MIVRGDAGDVTVRATAGEVILSGSDGVISHTAHSFNNTATFNSTANFNDTATFNSQINAWGNATFGNAHSDNLTVNSSASFNNMGNIKSTASAITWQVADGIDGLSPGGNNGALMFFTGSGGDLMKFHTSGSAKGVVMASNVYMNSVGNNELQPAQNTAFYVSSSVNGYVTRTTGQQVFSNAAGVGLSATDAVLNITAADESITVNANDLQVNLAVNSGLAVTGSGGTGGISLSGSNLVAGAFDHGSWYNDTIMFVDLNDLQNGSHPVKKISMADVATKLAGANLTATNGVLAASGGGGGGGIFTEINATQAATTSSVSIGTSGSPAATLHVSSSGNEALFRVDGLTETAPALFVTGSGRVGIGIADPAVALEIDGHITFGTGFGGGYLANRGAETTRLRFGADDATSIALECGGVQLLLVDNDSPDKVILGAAADNNIIVSGSLIVSGSISGSTTIQGASLSVDGDVTAGRAGIGTAGAPNGILEVSGSQETSGTPLFRVTGDSPAAVTAAGPPPPIFFVTGSGRVGIGTSTPSRLLEISGSDSVLMKFTSQLRRSYSMGSNGYGFMIFDDSTGGTPGYRFVISDTAGRLGYTGIGPGVTSPQAQLHVSSSGDISNYGVFRVDGDAAPNILFVTGSGLVGIGTATPTAQLAVNGAAHITGSILPGTDNTHDLGSSAMRWANVYTGDLHLANDRGNWTVVEESDYLTIRNNKTGKRFKLLMEEID